MSKKKAGVKKGSEQAQTYADRVNAAKHATNLTIFYDGMQQTLDVTMLVLNQGFGFGCERLKKFNDAFSEMFAEAMKMSREDKDDKDQWYSIQKFEEALKQA